MGKMHCVFTSATTVNKVEKYTAKKENSTNIKYPKFSEEKQQQIAKQTRNNKKKVMKNKQTKKNY